MTGPSYSAHTPAISCLVSACGSSVGKLRRTSFLWRFLVPRPIKRANRSQKSSCHPQLLSALSATTDAEPLYDSDMPLSPVPRDRVRDPLEPVSSEPLGSAKNCMLLQSVFKSIKEDMIENHHLYWLLPVPSQMGQTQPEKKPHGPHDSQPLYPVSGRRIDTGS